MKNIIDYCKQKQLPLAFISLDQEKAFDRINYDFLFQTLSAFNFGPSLIRWIKTLYNDVCSSVIVNNHISDPITLHRGLRQGCSLSPLLYVLCLKPFAIKTIRINKFQELNFQVPLHCLSCLYMQMIVWLFAPVTLL